MKERQIDRGIRSWAARLANRKNTKRIVAWILAVGVLVAFALVALGALFGGTRAHRAGAAGPQLRRRDPRAGRDLALDVNAVWWLFKGIVITFVVFVALRNRWVRDWLTSPEYNEATGLRRRYIEDGGGPVESKAKMSVGEAIYMIGDLRDRCAADPGRGGADFLRGGELSGTGRGRAPPDRGAVCARWTFRG